LARRCRDNSGTIGRHELFAGLRLAFGPDYKDLTQGKVDDLIAEFDVDDNGVLDFGKFAALVAKLHEARD